MAHWLFKSEPSAWSFDMLVAAGEKGTDWSGIRNHSAKLNMMAMKTGERGFFYHSNEGKAIVGIIEVIKPYYPDPSDASGKFGMVDIKAVKPLPRPVTLEAIARDAGVGIGTLYRHFPNREALVEAIYRTELAEVAAAAERLLKRHPPKTALRRWMDRYASFVAAKRGMAESLHAMFDSGAMQPSQTRDSIAGAVDLLLRAGADDGSLRSDVQADDVVSSLIGIFLVSGSPEQTGRMLDLLVAGIAA